MVERKKQHSGVAGPIFLIFIGVILLLNNFGRLDWSIWETLFTLWPVFLIGIGLDILISRHSWFGSLLVAVAIIVMLVGGTFLLSNKSLLGNEFVAEEFLQELQGAKQAEVSMQLSVGELRIQPMETSDQLLNGKYYNRNQQHPPYSVEYSVDNGTGRYNFSEQGQSVTVYPFNNRQKRLDIQLNKNIPIALEVKKGVGYSNVNLAQIQITNLDASTAVGELEVVLPENQNLNVDLSIAIGNIYLKVPKDTAIQIMLDGGIGSHNIPAGLVKIGDHMYQSEGYNTATQRIDIKLSSAIGNINISY